MRWTLCALALLAALVPVLGDAEARIDGKRTLVVLEREAMKETHSQFLEDLQARGHSLKFALASDTDITLRKYGEFLFDNLILLVPTAEEFGSLEISSLTEFVDEGGSILLATSEDVSETVRDFAAECGVDFDADGSRVIDHFNFHAPDKTHTTVYSAAFIGAPHVVGTLDAASAPVVFRGVGHSVDPGNILAVPILTAEATAYSAVPHKPLQDEPESTGHDVLLVSAIQARNNARVTFAGSVDLFSNNFFASPITPALPSARSFPASSNREFAAAVAQWTFLQRGVLRARNVTHRKADGTSPETQLAHEEKKDLPRSLYPEPEIARDTLVYRIKDDIRYSVVVEELRNGEWQPFQAEDMQLEFVMLDPYVRTNLKADARGEFSTVFKAPDTYGIFKFRVMYRRMGFTTLFLSNQVSVRPFRHNEYERFIDSAMPYYASVFSMMAGFFVFGFVFLYHRDT